MDRHELNIGRREMMRNVLKLFSLDALLQPGPATRRAQPLVKPIADAKSTAPPAVDTKSAPPAVILPMAPQEPVISQAPVIPPASEAAPTAKSESSGDIDLRPVDWNEESREELPIRNAKRIKFLLTQESELQTIARIKNDKMRFINERAGQTKTQAQLQQLVEAARILREKCAS